MKRSVEEVKRRNRIAYVFLSVFLGLLIGAPLCIGMQPAEHSFGFVSSDHPVSMWKDGSDRWAYFSIGGGSVASLSERARNELAAKGYKEDASQKPWFRFVKGNSEVVVCNHDEFALSGEFCHSKLLREQGGTLDYDAPCVLVKNGPGTSGSIMAFHLKKLMHGW